jgi:cyclophilin family peptidyl-prolyl cis-trans isomerase
MSKIEGLETRRMLAAPFLRVGNVTADNRGEVVIQLSERATGVKGAAVQIYTAGTDGKMFTNDDVRESARISYSVNKKQIKLTANIAKDKPYRIKLDGKTRIKAEDDGTLLDGNFNGTLASGDGVAGGNFEAVFNRDTSNTPEVVMRTSQGDIWLKMRGDVAPATVSNFLSYANTKRYDNTFVFRNEPGFVIQGGSLQIQNDGLDATDIVKTITDADLEDEAPGEISNTRATMAFARGGGDDATNQWFINLGNNAGLDSQGFTVFAEVTRGSISVADTISSKPIVALEKGNYNGASAPFGVLENVDVAGTTVAHVPVTSQSDVTGSNQTVVGLGNLETQFLVTGGLQPIRDLMVIYRVASLMKISAKS